MKEKIKNDILAFQNQNLKESTKNLFNTLGYKSERTTQIKNSNYQGFKDAFFDAGTVFNKEKALIHDWKSVDLIFQLTDDELGFDKDLKNKNINTEEIMSYLFLAIELTKSEYTRTQLAQISREINKVFSMPVLTLFKYGNLITFSVINRRLNKLDRSKDVLEKITMIKDISILKPHRAHLEILRELSTDNITANNFKELHQAWEKALDIQVLNNKFYTELSNWFFWATKEVRFPGYENQDDTYNEQNLIRLLTRLLFVWFIKEKGLIPEKLFNLKDLQSILKDDLEIKKNKDKVYLQHQSNYYKAILQNLFFATLNQELKKREFRKDGQNMGAHTLMRYKSYFINPDEFINLLDNTVPFMNGGLFECLDYMIDEKKGAKDVNKMVYIDGFSDRADNVLCLPDYLFFSEEETVDLSEQLNSKSESIKNTKVHGLINILNSYKFTITENTPIEEDIALDPELLGRVFENLLASYNPETKETARKQTGSFYTPREVVDFMVNESLHAYLKQALVNKAGMSADDAEVGLEFLLAYNEKEHLFEPEEVSILIQAIDECKILDLACGSGAFPMGILHKQVYILQKLDPKNKLWKERQIEKIKEMEDITLIDTLAKDVETAFENNELDYGRKLYLIENCIYGVDIQPIAIQISKLRFFISLIVDQKIDRTNKDNFGIKALPNLETKFVSANSLISIVKPDDKQTTIYDYYDSGETLKELKKVYHTLFSARSPETKKKYRQKERELRKLLSEQLQKENWSFESANKIAAWDPFAQNKSSSWFDPEWMFGVFDGFDIVIGNPPYVQLQKFKGSSLQKLYKEQNFVTYDSMGDIYGLFYEKGISLLKDNGHLCLITSNKWMRAGYGEKLRKYFSEYNPKVLIDLGPGVFKSATVDTNILLIEKNENQNSLRALTYYSDLKSINEAMSIDSITLKKVSHDSWFIGNSAEISLKEKIESIGKPLKDWDVNIYRGVLTGLNEAFIIDTPTKERLCIEDPKSAEIIKPILRGRDIKRYSYEWAGLWIIFVPWHFPLHEDSSIQGSSDKAEKEFQIQYPAIYQHLLHYKPALSSRNKAETGIRYEWYALQRCAATYYDEFEKEKIVWQELTQGCRFSYDDMLAFASNTAYIMTGKDLKYLLSYLNSKLNEFTYTNWYCTKMGANGIRWLNQHVVEIPVPPKTHQNKPLIEKIELLVDEILYLKKASSIESTDETAALEKEIDQLVYQLYELTEEEIALVEKG